jgi:hypothetical protein
MMAPTHLAVSLALALPVALAAPDLASHAVVGAAVGGLAPDLDLFAGEHRRTLHFPLLGLGAALAVAALAAWVVLGPGATGRTGLAGPAVALSIGTLAAAVHAASDVLGAGTELRPWERTSTDAVFDHVRGRWLRARYVVRYDGAPEDLALTVAFALPALVLDTPARPLAAAAVAVAVPYALLRKRLPKYFSRIV